MARWAPSPARCREHEAGLRCDRGRGLRTTRSVSGLHFFRCRRAVRGRSASHPRGGECHRSVWLRSDLLPIDRQPQVRALLREYLASRLETRPLSRRAGSFDIGWICASSGIANISRPRPSMLSNGMPSSSRVQRTRELAVPVVGKVLPELPFFAPVSARCS
jgi:hypothetical protein